MSCSVFFQFVDIEEDIRSLQLDSAGSVRQTRMVYFKLGWILYLAFRLCFNFQCLYQILAEENNGMANPEEEKPEEVENEDKMEEGW